MVEYLICSREHLSSCWAAAQSGAFKGFNIPPDLKGDEFGDALLEALSVVGQEAVLAFVNYGNSRRAVALFTWTGDDRRIQPQVFWFPWASPRNKLEATLRFIDEARRGEKLVLWYVRERDEKFFRHLAFYGMMRFCGRVDSYFDDGKPALLFFSRERWGL